MISFRNRGLKCLIWDTKEVPFRTKWRSLKRKFHKQSELLRQQWCQNNFLPGFDSCHWQKQQTAILRWICLPYSQRGYWNGAWHDNWCDLASSCRLINLQYNSWTIYRQIKCNFVDLVDCLNTKRPKNWCLPDTSCCLKPMLVLENCLTT